MKVKVRNMKIVMWTQVKKIKQNCSHSFSIRKIMEFTSTYYNSVRVVKRAISLASVSRLDLVKPVKAVCHLNDSNRRV